MYTSFPQRPVTLFVVTALIGFLIGCSHTSENKPSDVTVFQGEGEKWEVSIPNEVISKNGRKYFTSTFRYKGNPEELKEVERITFALGTALGTQTINVYDPSYKEKLVKTGGYQEEYEDRYGIIIEDIVNRKTNVFKLEYAFQEAESGHDTLDSIKDKVLIIVRWEDGENQFQDRIASQ